jgi:hypothetical protein
MRKRRERAGKDKERGIHVSLLSANQMDSFIMPQIVCFFGYTVSHWICV